MINLIFRIKTDFWGEKNHSFNKNKGNIQSRNSLKIMCNFLCMGMEGVKMGWG